MPVIPSQVNKPKRGRPPKSAVVARAETYTPLPTEAEPQPKPVPVPDAEMEVAFDPYSENDFLKFKKFPDTYVLRWCNPNYRRTRGWRGWQPVKWSDDIGRNLGDYLIDPPHRFEGMATMDDYIRAGNDLVLCKLHAGVWFARKRAMRERRDDIMSHLQGAKLVAAEDRSSEEPEQYEQADVGKPLQGMPLPPTRPRANIVSPVRKTRNK